eukprot:Skav222465  [mRNA]  locus=scaffold2163:118278:123645:+ [translate_table: standard]
MQDQIALAELSQKDAQMDIATAPVYRHYQTLAVGAIWLSCHGWEGWFVKCVAGEGASSSLLLHASAAPEEQCVHRTKAPWTDQVLEDYAICPLKPTDGADCRVLFFSAVGSHFRTTVKQNALHLHGSGLVDIFLAHPGTSDLVDWQKDPGAATAAGSVADDYLTQEHGLGGYCWYWIADEDVDLTRLNLRRNLAGATDQNCSTLFHLGPLQH